MADPQTRTGWQFTENKIPTQVGVCSEPVIYTDALERRRVKTDLKVVYCKEKITFVERAAGTEGWGPFKRTKWVRVSGSERASYEYASNNENFDLSYDPDSYRTVDVIMRELKEACASRYDKLALRMNNERRNVRCQ